MKSVIVHGVHSLNVGDDLFFQILAERYPTTRFIMVAPKFYKKAFGNKWRGVVVINDGILSRVFSFIGKICGIPSVAFTYAWLLIRYRVDLFMIVGGSLFMEGKSSMPSFIRGINKMRKIRSSLKIVVVGSNFGPCKTDIWKFKVGNALQLADDVCFRDIASYEEFKNLPNIRWGNDIVMHLNRMVFKNKNNSVCVNIRSVDRWPTLKPYKAQYLNTVKELISYYQREGYTINLLSFCNVYGDNEITKELYNLLDDKRGVDLLCYDGDLDKVLNLISKSMIMIGTRFHAIVLGLVFNLKVLPISYSVKTENMLKSYNAWNDNYDFCNFCNAETETLLQYLITEHRIDVKKNTMFDYVDKLLIKN